MEEKLLNNITKDEQEELVKELEKEIAELGIMKWTQIVRQNNKEGFYYE